MGEMPGSEVYSHVSLRSRHILQVGRSPLHLLSVSMYVSGKRAMFRRRGKRTHALCLWRNAHLRFSLATVVARHRDLLTCLFRQSHRSLLVKKLWRFLLVMRCMTYCGAISIIVSYQKRIMFAPFWLWRRFSPLVTASSLLRRACAFDRRHCQLVGGMHVLGHRRTERFPIHQ